MSRAALGPSLQVRHGRKVQAVPEFTRSFGLAAALLSF